MGKLIFCANCQTDTFHKVEVFPTEVMATCNCGRFIKFPPLKQAGALRAMFEDHKIANTGQIVAKPYVPDAEVVAAIENA